ncbi:MAG: alpha/beta hydrolase [Deltaproteobacteria bacterium]|nr:alpha/beta hydrolase [Deltaproteobacteria bacterium]
MNHSPRSYEPYWEVHGKNGPHILLLHGFLSSRAQWIPNIASLSQTARLVIVELLGHGRSPAPDRPDAYSPAGYISAFENIRKSLGISQWMLCGQSLGAGLTLRYALECPERVTAQIFTNTTSAFREIHDMEETRKGTTASAEAILQEGIDGIRKLPIHPANARRLRADVKAALVEDSKLISPLGVANTMRYTFPQLSVRQEIHKNTTPTLLISGRQEKRFTPFRNFAEANMPHLHIVEFNGGHAVNIDAADDFNGAAKDFIKKHLSATC